MVELLRTNDLVLISYVQALLGGAGVGLVVLDGHMSVMEGSVGALPRRLMVGQDDLDRARTLLGEANVLDANDLDAKVADAKVADAKVADAKVADAKVADD